MKFCRPIYRSLYKVAPELAKKTFLAHASFYVSFGDDVGGGVELMRG
jgi:hypothetical protein